MSDTSIVNTTYDEVASTNLCRSHDHNSQKGSYDMEKGEHDPTACHEKHDPTACHFITNSSEPEKSLQGASLLHLACSSDNYVMLELLLQFGADINKLDCRGRTPLHHCICTGNNQLAKFLLRR